MARQRRRVSDSVPRLFEPEQFRLRPTGESRLRAIARRAAPVWTDRELRREENRRTMRRLREWGADLAQRFGLEYTALEAERAGVNAHFGVCYEDGLIRIRLRHATTGRLLKESSLVDTLCHELAHLVHFNHGKRFRRLYEKILQTARELGYYRPGPEQTAKPRQGRLFDGTGCGTRPV